MTTTIQLLERFKKTTGCQTDYQAAKSLGITQATISKWRRGQHMDDTTAVQIAQALHLDPIETVARVQMDRPLKGRERKVWEQYVASFAPAVLAIPVVGYVTYCILW